MATSAFRSSTKRTPVGKASTSDEESSSSKVYGHRRHRSLSRFSHRMPNSGTDEIPGRGGRFVNTTRGSGFPEISLDDLAIQLFDAFSADRATSPSSSRKSDVSGGGEVSVGHRRGRSVSRQGSKSDFSRRLDAETESSRRRRSVSRQPSNGGPNGRLFSETESSMRRRSTSRPVTRRAEADGGVAARTGSERGNSRRRRSLSVTPFHISDSESDVDHFRSSSNCGNGNPFCGNSREPGTRCLVAQSSPGLRKSFSQRDDDHSSQSSGLTDDDGKDLCYGKSGIQRGVREVRKQKKMEHPALTSSLDEESRKELCHAMGMIKMEIGQGAVKSDKSVVDNGFGSRSKMRNGLNTVSPLKRSSAKDLQRQVKLKQDMLAEILSEGRSHGTELSSTVNGLHTCQDGSAVLKRSACCRMSECLTEEAEKYIEEFISNIEDTDISSLDDERSETSSSLGIIKPEIQSPTMLKSIPMESEGIMLPWLQWETPCEISPLSWTKLVSGHSITGRGSWSPVDSSTKSVEQPIPWNQIPMEETGKLRFDIDDYMQRESKDEFLFQSWSNRNRISSGRLMLCNHRF